MDIYAYIRKDHRNVAAMMEDIPAIRLPVARQSLFEQIRTELIAHGRNETEIFYAAVARAGGDLLSERMKRSAQEHQDIELLLTVLDVTPVASDLWMQKFGELKQAVTRHVEEENEIFARARAVLTPAQARQLVSEMDSVKQACLTEVEFDIPAL